MQDLLTFEDFPVGAVFPLGPYEVTAEAIIEFAAEFDPQPFHLDPESEQAQAVGGLIASGWHSSAILMRMMCDAYLLRTASEGSSGLDEVRWLKPVRPGDVLTGTSTVLEARLSRSTPGRGIVSHRYDVQNQNGETVLSVSGSGMIATAAAVAERGVST
ncbi:MAG: MaoC family dehydratase [Pseudomonadota bacterium]